MKRVKLLSGETFVVLTINEYDDLSAHRDRALARRRIRYGRVPRLDDQEQIAYYRAKTPLEFFRKRSQRKQCDVARSVGISSSHLSRMERGAMAIRSDLLQKLADILHVLPKQILKTKG